MIRLNRLVGRDIGRHRVIDKTITGNVLGLWGVSGTGKSTVEQLVEWLLTGKIEHPDPISEFVRNSEIEDIKKMTGEGYFEVDGKPMEIRRSQSKAGTSTRELKWEKQGSEWGVTEKSAAGVDSLMTSLIGANQKAISSIVFIRQGSFGKLFSGLDADRRDFFVRLLMLGHLEKIAQVVDTYRKQMLGSVQDLSGQRDQAEAFYNQARANFEEVDDALSRMRSYGKELEAGAELLRLWDRSIVCEATMKEKGLVLNAGLAELDLDRERMDAWLTKSAADLAQLREDLKTAQGRLTSRNHHFANQSKLSQEIAQIEAWLEKSAKLAELDVKIAGVAESASKPDPRKRIGVLDAWEHNYRTVEGLEKRFKELPEVDQAGLSAKTAAAESARKLASDNYAKWQTAKTDLADLQKLQEVASAHGASESCRLCGNEHPDPKFITQAIANTTELVKRLADESNECEDKRREAAQALQEAENAAATLKEQRNTLQVAIIQERTALQSAPDAASITTERDELNMRLPSYDAAKSMYDHLCGERNALTLAMGDVTHTANERDSKKVELDLANNMLGMLPPQAELEATINRLTEEGTALRPKTDKLLLQRDAYNDAKSEFLASSSAIFAKVEELTTKVPFLISSAQALAPVVTQESIQTVLANLREKQSEFDAQTGKVSAANKAMVDADKALQELDVRIEEQKSRITIGKELENVRSAFLPSGITTDYLSHQFERIAIATQDHLAQMSADFMVVASEKRALSFDFLRLNEPGGAWLSQNRMSGGQQVKLAIAVLLAIHELIIPQVGFMVLDEPSTHLDADSRIALAEVLREIGKRGNFQLIVCDHSPELKDAYTDIIELADDTQNGDRRGNTKPGHALSSLQ